MVIPVRSTAALHAQARGGERPATISSGSGSILIGINVALPDQYMKKLTPQGSVLNRNTYGDIPEAYDEGVDTDDSPDEAHIIHPATRSITERSSVEGPYLMINELFPRDEPPNTCWEKLSEAEMTDLLDSIPAKAVRILGIKEKKKKSRWRVKLF